MMRSLLRVSAVTVILLMCLTVGCDHPKPTGLVILIDESSSFGYWREATEGAAFVIRTAEPQTRVVIIGIDDHGFDPDDVRLSATLDQAQLRATAEAKALARQARALSRRDDTGAGTDILGALEQAEYYCARLSDSGKYQWKLLIMSDLVIDTGPRVAGCSERLHFPSGTMCTAAFVAERGAASFKSTCAWWTEWFQRAGLDIRPGQFLPPALSKDYRNLGAVLRRPAQAQQAGSQ